MKHCIVTMLLFVHYQFACGQTDTSRQFLQTNSKSNLYYVDLKDADLKVYAMGRYYDVAGQGYAIVKTDTLQKQPDGSYGGRYYRIIDEKDGLYLVNTLRKNSKSRLDTASASNLVNKNLNNAYYLDQYLDMSRKLNAAYPLNRFDFRQGFYTWKAMAEQAKEMDYQQFREIADKRFKEINDSTSIVQDKNTRLANYINKNIHSIDYTTLKDSLSQLPAEYVSNSSYYKTVIDTIALRQPEYFFRLAEDLPEDRKVILPDCSALKGTMR
jgi:hypothetical protein